MSGNKRARKLAKAKYERQSAKRATAAARRKRINRIVTVAVVVALVAVVGVLTVRGASGGSSDGPTPAPTVSPTSTDSPSPSPSPSPVDGCTEPKAPRADDMSWPTPPADTLKPDTTYTITLATNCGDIDIIADPQVVKAAPKTVNSMVFLAKEKYFDLTACHRLTTAGIFVLQCGDPKGDGTGGPGYTVPDENLPKEGTDDYPAGTVAMANAGPGTSGSQFFIVYENTTLPPNYTIWGKVSPAGLDIVRRIAAAGVAGGGSDGSPAQPVTIVKATTSTS